MTSRAARLTTSLQRPPKHSRRGRSARSIRGCEAASYRELGWSSHSRPTRRIARDEYASLRREVQHRTRVPLSKAPGEGEWRVGEQSAEATSKQFSLSGRLAVLLCSTSFSIAFSVSGVGIKTHSSLLSLSAMSARTNVSVSCGNTMRAPTLTLNVVERRS